MEKEQSRKKNEITKHMKKMKVSSMDEIIKRVYEMKSIKEGLNDMIDSYQKDINVLKEEVETQRVKKSKFELVNIGHNDFVCDIRTEDEQILLEQEELEIYIEKTYHKSFMDAELPYDKTNSKSKLYLYEKNLNKLIFVKNDFEYKHKKLHNIINNSCTTISRVMYQLNDKQKEKHCEVSNDKVVNYLSQIGQRLERMLAYIYSRNKNEKEEIAEENEINFDYVEINGVRSSKPPDYLGQNPGRLGSGQSEKSEFIDNYMDALYKDPSTTDFEKIRKEALGSDQSEENLED